MASCLLRANGLASIEADDRGRLRSLTSLPWVNVTPRMNDNGVLLFDHLPMMPRGAGQRRTYAREDVILLKDRSDDGVLGVSRLQRAAGAMSYAVQIQSTAQSFSQNLARPGACSAPTST